LILSLKEIIESVEAHDIDISGRLDDFPPKLREWVLSHNYYWGLAAYVELYKVGRVLELGTCTGSSAVVMSRAGATVDTYDVRDIWELNCWPENVTRYIADNPNYIHSVDLSPYDMIFVDIDHWGKDEQQIHTKFTKEYSGVVFYDDIWLNEQMRYFWEGIEQEKQGCFWNTTSGFGIVQY
jgi:hypothetical protein